MSELKYSVITEIKKSDKSNVYLAAVDGFDGPVVVKEIIHGNYQVFEALMGMECDYLPKIYHVEEINKGLLVVEQYIDGELLSDVLASGKLTEIDCINIVEQICAALEVLHSHKPALIHRDIKPSNIIVTSKGKVKLIDYDSTRLFKEEAELDTRLLGTEKYAAPEQYGFAQTDCRSDIYSLGVVLEKFTTYIPTEKKKAWNRIVEKCTLFSPDSRYQSVSEVELHIRKLSRKKLINCKVLAYAGLVATLGIGLLILIISGNSDELNDEATITSTAEKIINAEAQANTKDNVSNINSDSTDDSTEKVAEITTEEITTDKIITEDDNIDRRPPEWRNLATDSENIVKLKEEIRIYSMVVMYHFKDRMQDRDFLYQVRELESQANCLLGVSLINCDSGQGVSIKEDDYKVQDNVIVISKEYFNSLEDGYYMLKAVVGLSDGGVMECGVVVYIAESDLFTEQDMYLQNTTFDYSLGSEEKLHLVLKNDSIREIECLYSNEGIRVDDSMYKVLQNGRILEISNEYLCQFNIGERLVLYIKTKDGSKLEVSVITK